MYISKNEYIHHFYILIELIRLVLANKNNLDIEVIFVHIYG